MADTSGILNQLKKHITLDDRESLYFSSLLIHAQVKQGEYVEKIGVISQNFIHVETGCLMSYYTDKQGDDHVVQFATAGWWAGDLQSISWQKPAIYATRAL